jgi:hypothetical protein
VNPLLADPPAAQSSEQPTASGPPSVPPDGTPEGATPAQTQFEGPPSHVCAHCETPLQEGQQWCLNCGACEPGSLGERPSWRPLTTLALTAAVLAAGAAVAAAPALNTHNAVSHPAVVALAPATPVVATPTTTPSLPATPGASTPHAAKKGSPNNLLFPPSTSKPPKIPVPAAGTPEKTGGSAGESTGSSGKSTESGSGSTTTTPAKSKTTETGASTTESKKSKEGSSGGEQPSPILLDTDAATTYNPYGYPEAGFGDPALAIDGEPSTAWTAQVQAHSFPNMAEGLLIDLREPTKLGSLELRTPTRGMTVQVYTANGTKAPTTITEPGWVLLSGSHTLKKTVTHLKLHAEGRTFRWLVVWIVKAPATAQSTPQAPGHVALSEVALYPPTSSS